MKRLRTANLQEDPNLKIKIARLCRRWNQYDLAKRSGVAQSRISLIESGRVLPSANERGRLAGALGKEPEELFDER
jgi:transcriptional regulator with XRE-family HTH domain